MPAVLWERCLAALAWRCANLVLIPSPTLMSYIVASKTREFLNANGMMVSGELAEALSAKVEELLKTAVARAGENGRKTVRACDL